MAHDTRELTAKPPRTPEEDLFFEENERRERTKIISDGALGGLAVGQSSLASLASLAPVDEADLLEPEALLQRRSSGRDRERGWQEQLRASVRTAGELARVLRLTNEELEGARRAEQEGLPIAITPYYLSLCDPDDARCPVRMQCVPRIEESREVPGDMIDPLGEVEHEVAPYLVRRYPDRVLLLATDRCAVYCRFCTRSRIVGDGGGPSPLSALEPAFEWIRTHPEIRDVIVSGGDPLAMATDRLDRLLERIRAIPTVETIRLATRVPVTLPMRVTSELLHALRKHHPVWVMTHFNHPKELTPESLAACNRLADSGFPVMNQTVLLAGINDDASTLETLFRGLVRARVRPYYLLQADPVRGTGHLRTPLAAGIAIMEQLQGRLSGIALPKLICDTPGGRGKVPLSPDYVVRRPGEGHGVTVLRTFRGEEVAYVDAPVVVGPFNRDPQTR